MKAEPEIKYIQQMRLIGISNSMSHTNNLTTELWRTFMPRRKELCAKTHNELISLQIYNSISDILNYNPSNIFIKWACAEVSEEHPVPEGMQDMLLDEGYYAVFTYKGRPSDAGTFFQYIFSQWLPASIYRLDNRPHFEVLTERYKNEDTESEEDIWIPIIKK